MIRINLLGQPRPKKVRAGGAPLEGAVQIAFVVVALAIGGIALFMHWRILHNQYLQDREIISQLTARKTQLLATKAEVDRRTQEKALLQQRINVIEQLQRGRSGGQELLDAVANTVNRVDALWMSHIKRTGNSLEIEGSADSMNAVADYISELKRSGYFDKVEISDTKQDDRRPAITTFTFKLTADFTLPNQTPAAQQGQAKAGKS
ncbi:MAG TPA: PilN domain-containing protein [Candidatus Binatia bacterium]|nr:PilN domain-containing protein [Candidatus Binatia bacterium]